MTSSGESLVDEPQGFSAWRGLHRRRPLPLDLIRLPLSRPWWHGDADRCQRLITKRAELEVGPQRNGEAHPRIHRDDLLPTVELAPHLATPMHAEPNLLHSPMGNSNRRLTGREFKMGKTAAAQPEEDANL